MRIFPALMIAVLLASCGQSPDVRVPADHPASAQAAEAPPTPASTTLDVIAPVDTHPAPAISDHVEHQHHDAAPQVSDADQQASVYTCPMHPEVQSDKPGRCPKCHMKLILKKTDDQGER